MTACPEPRPELSPRAVYLHVPFCVKRCGYCDFATAALADDEATRQHRQQFYLNAIRREIAAAPPRPAATVYFGGGTPSVLAPPVLGDLLERVTLHGGRDGAELTLEANPTTVELSRFTELRQLGFNRLSLGIQSFDDELLAWLGRTHSAAEAIAAYEAARAAGFENVSLDLIFGLHQQTLHNWRRALATMVALAPEHISVYGLTVEPGTPLALQVDHGLRLPDDDFQADCYELAIDLLAAAGYEHYEISNFARPGCRSRHNQVYWRNEEYRGFGPGAASYVGRRRWTNARNLSEYVARLSTGQEPAEESEERDLAGEQRETMYLGLRTIEGVSSEAYRQRYGVRPDELFAPELTRCVERGLLEQAGDRWCLTRTGLLLANQVFLEFV